MKNNSNINIVNISLIIISIIVMIYFGYQFFKPVLDFVNFNIEEINYVSVINNYFK
jgi:hypothetical protein